MFKILSKGYAVLAFLLISTLTGSLYGSNPVKVKASNVDGEITYSGSNSEWVRRLLTRVSDWRCPSDSGSDSGQPPDVGETDCMRDSYVKAAVLFAWAAECYNRSEQE